MIEYITIYHIICRYVLHFSMIEYIQYSQKKDRVYTTLFMISIYYLLNVWSSTLKKIPCRRNILYLRYNLENRVYMFRKHTFNASSVEVCIYFHLTTFILKEACTYRVEHQIGFSPHRTQIA